MKHPKYLKQGDEVRILASARKISEDEVEYSRKVLESWGLEVSYGKHLFNEDDQFAGTEVQRAEDLQLALDDEKVKAILFARGGYGSVQILDRLDWSAFNERPKWLVGYSDITVFHAYLNRQLNTESIHAAMSVNIKEDQSGLSEAALESIKRALFGEELTYRFNNSKLNQFFNGEIEGELIGGNLSILYSLSGSDAQINGEGKIIFMEDLDEYLYHIDRMLMNLIRSGIFKGCKGVLVGGMSDMNDNTIPYGKTAQEIIAHRLRDLKIPLLFDFPAGHINDNRSLIMGRKVIISELEDQLQLKFHERA